MQMSFELALTNLSGNCQWELFRQAFPFPWAAVGSLNSPAFSQKLQDIAADKTRLSDHFDGLHTVQLKPDQADFLHVNYKLFVSLICL